MDLPEAPPSVPPEDPFARSWQRTTLPLPVRSTRYVVGALLIAVIVTVVVATYLRIEQQLQATVDSQLEAMLSDHVHVASEWVERRRELTERTAEFPDVVAAAGLANQGQTSQAQAMASLQSAISTLRLAGYVSEAGLLSADGQRVLVASPPGGIPSNPQASLFSLVQGSRKIALSQDVARRRAFTIAPVMSGGHRLAWLVLATSPDSMSRSLDSASGQERSYAFDQHGLVVVSDDPSAATASPSPGPPPDRALRVARGIERGPSMGQRVDQYLTREGLQVVGAWTWLDEYGFGVVTEVPMQAAHRSIKLLRQSFLVLVTLVGAAILGFIALGRWTLRVREESLLMTRRLGRLARAIQPLSAALEHDPSAVLLVDHEGTVVYANASSHRVLGVNAPLLGRDVDAVFEGLHHELQIALASGQDSIVAQGNDSLDETLLVSSRSLSIDGTPHYLYMLRPITQQVRRQEVEHWKKLIRVLSHELNNALAPITSLISSARKVNQMTHRDERLGQIFESIAERTSHLLSFLEGYRQVARLPRPAPREVDWTNFLHSLSSQKKFRHTGRVPDTPGFFDPIQLERVITNVLNNAHEAGSPEDQIEIELLEESEGFRINIMDRGTGMPEAVLKQAMLPFFSTKRTGTGVGLALSREIIEAHGGQLTLANREGGGLTVSCFLPTPSTPPSRTSMGKLPLGQDLPFRPSSVPPTARSSSSVSASKRAGPAPLGVRLPEDEDR